VSASSDERWDKPGPGTWTLDGAHHVGPVTLVMQDVFPRAMANGFRSFTARYGLPISHIDVRYVNGAPYGSVVIAGVPPSDRPPPPAWLLRVLTRVHPELRRRDRQARTALAERTWHADLRRWFDELRPARQTSLRALQAVDPELLDDDQLAHHVEACVAELAAGLQEHFSLVGAASVPVGLYVLREAERGRTAGEAITDLTGAAAGSTAATLPVLRAIAAALADADVTPATLDDVRRASPVAATALDAYLAEYGQRVVGAFDVTGRRLVEMPDLVLRSIRTAAARAVPAMKPVDDDDVVAADARLAVASRDDHAGISCTWPLGLLRRALLAAGVRLHEAGALDQPDHALDGTASEVAALLRRAPEAPTASVLADRVATRSRLGTAAPPAILGRQEAPPNPSVFPAGMRQVAAAMGAFLGAVEAAPRGTPRGAGAADGIGVGAAPYVGRAVVAVDPGDAIARLEPGDVLVTTTTTPAFNCVLPVAGALVTAHGGLMSHAGIAARELGIPALLGVSDALVRIEDGAEVEVDPVAATVRVLRNGVDAG
jgi:phosphohistidine swiveling domain-containing protein